MEKSLATKTTAGSLGFKRTAGLIAVLTSLGAWLFITHFPFSSIASSSSDVDLLGSGWNYMPGASINTNGLYITHLGRTIVQQDGTQGQLNPPVNSYGTHLQMTGDFTVVADIKDIKGSATLQFYSSPPIVQDEFRVEPKSLRINLNNQTATVSTWDGYSNQNLYKQVPSSVKRYAFTPRAENTIVLTRKDGRLTVGVNEASIITLPRNTNFSGDAIWFGLDAENPGDNWTLSKLTAKSLNSGSVKAVNMQDNSVITKDNQGLQSLVTAKHSGFLVGAATALPPATMDSRYRQTAFNNFGSITTENVLKWQFVNPQPNIYDFHEADALVEMAAKNNILVHGHTLVFGEANPAWVQNLPTGTDADKRHVKNVMVDHIQQIIGHYKGRIASWDVVNEPLAGYDNETSDRLRHHKWHEAMGEGYIVTAFTAARHADPNAKLYINDFGLEEDGERWETLLALVTKLKSQGVPIDGVGFQAHVYESEDRIDSSVLRQHIRQLANIGLTARVSEMDVYDDDGESVQAKQYADILDVCISEPNCVSWTTWGVSDKYDLWQDDDNVLQHGRTFSWDERFDPKEVVLQMKSRLKN